MPEHYGNVTVARNVFREHGGMLRSGGAVLFKGATAGLPFSSPKLERTASISLALVAGAGAHICGGTFERIRLRAGSHYRLS
jgi:hypothetical protein